MVQKGTYLFASDKSGAWWTCIFQIYKGFKKVSAKSGDFVKISVKSIKIKDAVKKKSKFKSLIILTCYRIKKNDNSRWIFKLNSTILLKKRLSLISREILGPSLSIIRRKKFNYSFPGIL
jgi:ribosomal protein L14